MDGSDKDIWVPDIEILAGLRFSYKTAVREGFPRTAAQVQRYIEELDDERQRIQDIRNLNHKLQGTILGAF
jgi:hypothetical protein